MSRFTAELDGLNSRGELGLFPYLTAGYPSPDEWLDVLHLLVDAGANGLEIGMPYSDPLADGVTLQRAGSRALEQGITLHKLIEGLKSARLEKPIALMSYVNPLLAYGVDVLGSDAVAAGVDSLIVPDLPLSESGPMREMCARHGLGYVPMVAPTSTDKHLDEVNRVEAPFVYCVALLGVTGARSALDENLANFLDHIRSRVRHPLVVGFGISQPEHLAALRGHAQGAIVASAIADILETHGADGERTSLREYLTTLKVACQKRPSTSVV